MKNFVISLSTETKRRDHITTEFQRQNIAFSFFDAITPDTMNDVADEVGIDILTSELRKSEIACLLSHIALWKKAIDEDMEYIAIFEDDIHLGENADRFLNNNTWIKSNFDIIKLEAFYDEIIVKANVKATSIYNRELLTLGGKHLGCGGYILSKASAIKLLERTKQYEKLIPVDHIVFNDYLLNSDANIYQLIPGLCIQDHKLMKTHDNFPSHLELDRNLRKGEKLYKPQLSFSQKARREIFRIIKDIIHFFTRTKIRDKTLKLIKLKFK